MQAATNEGYTGMPAGLACSGGLLAQYRCAPPEHGNAQLPSVLVIVTVLFGEKRPVWVTCSKEGRQSPAKQQEVSYGAEHA